MALFEAKNLRKRFGARVVLENVSLSVEEGSVHGIMGPNGAGKTTCFHVLTGHYAPDGGSITFEGRDITGLKPHRIARMGISRSFQIMNLFDDTVVIENVMLALPEFRQRGMNPVRDVFGDSALIDRALAVLDQVGLAHRAWEKAKSLPYGERRALEIAVALAPEPRIVFLDEPTSGLGTEATRALAELIGKLRHRYTIVLIEHDMHFLFDLADRISVIHWGQVIDENTPAALRANKWVARSALGEVA
ncbi:ABC transporter ATP-binding protein [Roseibacterium sp. SDUM158017]|uniref:ABC transporter ATP-binding protein n=1 Tax=Roseicyclus salinarum TaxID=3036773 RepID=UPI0024158EE7|nr:ABC transporter ATP-binding protein [Roseibacterium sp. SDUM158017]MDG4647889.1 ABC transporter ATP-binding protein [Roseibacterium sp. SDUM158017]